MSCCLFIAGENAFAYTRSDCKKGKLYKFLNNLADFADGVGTGPSYLDQNDRMKQRELYKEIKQNCKERDKCV